MMNITNATEIRKLPYRTLRELASLLDIPGSRDWKALISVLPENTYSLAEINQFERANYRPNGSAAYELLKDFGTQLKTVGELVTYLEEINNQEALLLIRPHEPVYITEHPSSSIIQCGQDMTLKCRATGFPKPRYQWYFNRECLQDQLTAELTLKKVTTRDAGHYYCIATNPVGSEYTNVAEIQVVPMIAPIVRGVTGADNLKEPSPPGSQVQSRIMYPGQDFILSCPYDASSYQWYKNGYPIPTKCQKVLTFEPFQFGDEGFYSCKVLLADSREVVCNAANLIIAPNITPADAHFANSEFATGKVALIIANKDYQFTQQEELMHPINDAKLLSNQLKEIGFNVYFFVNLNRVEMELAIKAYCKVLEATSGMYSVFYFCGHGFEEHGITYLLPTDVPAEWNADAAISDTYIRHKIQEGNSTKFDLFLLDVCRIRANTDSCNSNPPSMNPPPFKAGAQCVIGYSTCPQAQAFEKRRDNNGLYMKHLARHITENMRIEHILEHVNKAVREEAELHHLTNAMHPTHTSYATKSFSLCDRVLPFTGYVAGEVDPTVLCFDFHRLPANYTLEFTHGIMCELSFEPECSNAFVLCVYPSNYGEAKYCDAQIIGVDNQSLDFGSEYINRERSALSEIMGRSLRCSESSSQTSSVQSASIARITKVTGLQRIGDSLTVTVKLEYALDGGRGLEEPLYQSHTYSRSEFGITKFFDVSDGEGSTCR